MQQQLDIVSERLAQWAARADTLIAVFAFGAIFGFVLRGLA